MAAYISIQEISSEDHLVEFDVEASDGASVFRTQMYVGRKHLGDVVADLERFKCEVYGGIYDLQFGHFGPEYAGGAFQARFHFDRSGHGPLSITIKAESEWHEFGKNKVASSVSLYVKSEPAQLDRFINELRTLSEGGSPRATLAALLPQWVQRLGSRK